MPTASSSPDLAGARPPSRVQAGHDLAPGEAILWQGRPSWRGTARHVLGGDLVLVYFALLAVIGLGRASVGSTSILSILGVLPPALLVGLIVAVLARSIARSTRYIVTPRRIVVRYGIAVPRSLSLPFSQIASLSVALRANGRGDVALRVRDASSLRYLKLWPNVRPLHLAIPQPMLRDIADAGLVATRLTRLLVEAEDARRALKAPPDRAIKRAI